MATPTFILPSAPTYTEGFVNGLNVYPNPTNFVANQVPFTRATTATRTNAAGLIELTPYNLLVWSEMFTNILWNKQQASILPNVVNAPNGTLTADKLVPDTTSAQHRIFNQTAFTGEGVLSVYAKADGYNFLSLARDGGVSGGAIIFNLSNGTISGTVVGFTPSIENVGNGWYRCSLSSSAMGSGSNLSYWIIARNANSTADYVGDGVSGILIWGAQLNEGALLPYQLTETRLNRPRVDFSLGGCPSLLLEPQRTNVLLNTIFSGSGSTPTSWTQPVATGTSVLTTSTLGVGVQACSQSATLQRPFLSQSFTLLANTTYSYSIYVESISGGLPNENILLASGLPVGATVTYIANGATVSSSATAVVGRLSIVIVVSVLGGSTAFRCGIGTSANSTGSILFSRPQLETGAYPTTYIPTSSASVTRNLEVAQLTGAQTLIGQTEGTLYWEGTLSSGFNDIFYLNRSVTNSVVLYKNANNSIVFRIYYGGSFLNTGNATTPYTGTVKIAAAYKSGDTVLYINGVQTGSLATAFAFTGDLADIVLNASGYFFATDFSKNVKSAAVYNTRLTNAELATLTTP